jgi:hypothetical protein
VQALGRVTLNAGALGADLLTLLAHKIGGKKVRGPGDLQRQPALATGRWQRVEEAVKLNRSTVAAQTIQWVAPHFGEVYLLKKEGGCVSDQNKRAWEQQ